MTTKTTTATVATMKVKSEDPVDVRTAGLHKEYLTLLGDMQEYKARRDEAEAEIKTIKVKLLNMQAKSGYKTVLTPDWRVTLTQGTNTTISKERLLELGVPVNTILRATKSTTYETLTVTSNKG